MQWKQQSSRTWASHTGCASVTRIVTEFSDFWVAVCHSGGDICGVPHCIYDRILNSDRGEKHHDAAIQAAEEHCAQHHRHGHTVKSASKLG